MNYSEWSLFMYCINHAIDDYFCIENRTKTDDEIYEYLQKIKNKLVEGKPELKTENPDTKKRGVENKKIDWYEINFVDVEGDRVLSFTGNWWLLDEVEGDDEAINKRITLPISNSDYQKLQTPKPEEETCCRVCGCSDSNPCPGGCSWVEPDLCNKCEG